MWVSLNVSCLESIGLLGFVDSYLSSSLGSFTSLFLQISLCPFLSSPEMMPLFLFLMMFHRSLRLYSHFFNLFSFCSSELIVSIALSSSLLILSFACSNLLLNPFSGFFISVMLFKFSICFCSFHAFCFFIDISILHIHCVS